MSGNPLGVFAQPLGKKSNCERMRGIFGVQSSGEFFLWFGGGNFFAVLIIYYPLFLSLLKNIYIIN